MTAPATVDQPPQSTPAPASARTATTRTCSECGAEEDWGRSSWCPSCGYYPLAGKRVEFGLTEEQKKAGVKGDEPQPTFLQLVPVWAWVLGAGCIAILVVSVWATLTLPSEGPTRVRWMISQALLSIAAVGTAHVAAFIFALPKNEKLGPFDLFLKPIDLWKPTFAALPSQPWKPWCLGWGGVGLLSAVGIIGGIDYMSIFDDWGVEKRAKQNVVAAVCEQARQQRKGAESLEQAMKDFTGEAVPEEEKEPTLQTVECVIFGYGKSSDGTIGSLLLATVVNSRMQQVARLSISELPEPARKKVEARLPGLQQKRAFVRSNTKATWVKPVLMCRLKFEEWTGSGSLVNPRFDCLLADVNVQ